ncbi:hypothetical protein SAMN04487983_1024106 [Streptomyces sp. yr375]|nr:hypothetical protein SAMN04487983_1024106 [Streptomyces sp. yr375]
MKGPVDQLFPPRPPEPAPECVTCADLARERAAANADGDYSRASDCNVRMREHGKHTGDHSPRSGGPVACQGR